MMQEGMGVIMDLMDYLIEFHKDAIRQGPGSDEATKKALRYIPGLDGNTRILGYFSQYIYVEEVA